MKNHWFYIIYFYLFLNVFSRCNGIQNKKIQSLPYDENENRIGVTFNNIVQVHHKIKINDESNNEGYGFLSLKAASIFNRYYVMKLTNSLFSRSMFSKDHFYRNVALYESLSRTNYFLYLIVLNDKNLKKIISLMNAAYSSNRKYETFKKRLISTFNYPNFELDNVVKNEMDQALSIYNKTRNDSYWNVIDALKSDGILLAKTFISASFIHGISGVVGLANHELLNICFSNAFFFNNIAPLDKFVMKNTFGSIISYVFKSYLIFFYPLIVPFRGAFSFILSSICLMQLGKIVHMIYRNLKKLYRTSRRKFYYAILKVNLLNQPQIHVYAMKLLYGDALILVSKIWKLSYVNITDHLKGDEMNPILNNLFEKNLGTGFFDFSESLFRYVVKSLNEMNILTNEGANFEDENEFKNETIINVLSYLTVTRRALYYEETYMRIVVARILAKFYTLILVNINEISKIHPKEFFNTDLESTYMNLYQKQMHQTHLQKIFSDITTKPFIKKNLRKINRGSIEFAMSLLKIRLFHYKSSLKHPYSSFYFDEKLKKHLNNAMKLVISGSNSIIGDLVKYGERFNILKECPIEIATRLGRTCNNDFEIKKLLFPLNIFINLLIPLYMQPEDILINNKIIPDILNFFEVMIDSKDLHLYKYLTGVVDFIFKNENVKTSNIDYHAEINKIITKEIHNVIEEVNAEKINSLKFHAYSIKKNDLFLHNTNGKLFKFTFDKENDKQNFSNLLKMTDYRDPLEYQSPYINFKPLISNNGTLAIQNYHQNFKGKIYTCHMCLEEDDDILVVNLIYHILWSSGLDKFSAFVFSSLIGAVKQMYHKGSSWNRALIDMVPTEFYHVHSIFMNKNSQLKNKTQNIFIKRIKYYGFHFNKYTFQSMFKSILSNTLIRINFFDLEQVASMISMSLLYSIYTHIQKYDLPLEETFKLQQQKIIESYYNVDKYSQNYESYTIEMINEAKKNKKINMENNSTITSDSNNNNDNNNSDDYSSNTTSNNSEVESINTNETKETEEVELSLDDEIIKNTKYLKLELESKEEVRNKIINQLIETNGSLPNYEMYPNLPAQCFFLLYYDFTPFIQRNLMGIENVINTLKNSTLGIEHIINSDRIQNETTLFALINQKDLINILCGTHLFFKKEDITLNDMFQYGNSDIAVKHLLIYLALLRIEKKYDHLPWKKYLTLEKYLDRRRKFYKTPLKYLRLKILNYKRILSRLRIKTQKYMGMILKKKNILKSLSPQTNFELIQNAEIFNKKYPLIYIKFEDILTHSNVFNKFKYTLLKYVSDKETVRNMINNFKLAPDTSLNNKKILNRILKIFNLIIYHKFNIDLRDISSKREYIKSDFFNTNKSKYILNFIKLPLEVENYLNQLIGFLKLLTDMKFTNFLFLKNFYIFIKLYIVTGDLDFATKDSVIYIASKNYLNFILNSMLEFENFKALFKSFNNINFNIKKFPLNYLNFKAKCYTIDGHNTYDIIINDQDKAKQIFKIMNYDIDSFYKDYLLIDLLYDDIKFVDISPYYEKIKDGKQNNTRNKLSKFFPGAKNASKGLSFDNINMLNDSLQNFAYLEKFLENTNIPLIPFSDFSFSVDGDSVRIYFKTKAVSAPFYKENILDLFKHVGKSFVSNYSQKVKCSFVSYPFNLYYWLILNPEKPNIETINKTGLIKEEDLMPQSDNQKEKMELLNDENLVKDILFNQIINKVDNKNDDNLSNASTSIKSFKSGTESDSESEYDSEYENISNSKPVDNISLSDKTNVIKPNLNTQYDSSNESYLSAQDTSDSETESLYEDSISVADSDSIIPPSTKQFHATPNDTVPLINTNVNNEQLNNNNDDATNKNDDKSLHQEYNNGNIANYETKNTSQVNSLDETKTDNPTGFIQKSKIEPFVFDSVMISEKINTTTQDKYGNFSRPYNIYVPKKDIFRNFHLIIKVVHSLISLNKFSIVNPKNILKKGIMILTNNNDFTKSQKMNPLINIMLLDINDTIQKLKLTTEKQYNAPNADILDIYNVIEFSLFNKYIIYPPLKRLNKTELNYILNVIDQGYFYHFMEIVSKLKGVNIDQRKIRNKIISIQEYVPLLEEKNIDDFYQIIIDSLRCENMECFNFLFNDFIMRMYNNNVLRVVNNYDLITPMKDIVNDHFGYIDDILVKVTNSYTLYKKNDNQFIKIYIDENSSSNSKLSYTELLFAALNVPQQMDKWASLYTLFNIRHIYLNVGYMLIGMKYIIKRKYRMFAHKYKFFKWLRITKKQQLYIP
ncbi:rhoptry neck protein 3, putative [Plasmodium berghei]|uniref:Rhoptry neck protein 3, putative n=2 Tax=Plasmodium berghei TaxID=5821 RepID=A0A509AVW7_PLABA|nr:rhoptry neck protein 3, putative [Plasmodium berghei ANKA]CXJ30043.1 rhoptry neck protein 3, putative [Plasmodium berghei]SCM27103.1 rhoptry neck protein 3, putative [Plasmodium berghei]SCN28829.1 rhoptry neck protein 3, putative [Plasmodium berghei]SCO63139.1 rhoptry neck protein 3, putative [Plasmodium berghei]SCO64576.1 rhoptry neck protein 3, putative [Plasmodium berghei]|eukprot:XP_034424475.1 rhoptry neck protein 3, putative [Plasmodium berghei ANKA]